MTDQIKHANPYNIPPQVRLWFGGDYIPRDWDQERVWLRSGIWAILVSENPNHWKHGGFDEDIVGYFSKDSDYDLTHEEQYIVEQMALGAYIGYETRYDVHPPFDIDRDYEEGLPTVRGITEQWPNNVGTHVGIEGFRYSALIAYRQVRDHLSFMAWRAGRSTPFNTQTKV